MSLNKDNTSMILDTGNISTTITNLSSVLEDPSTKLRDIMTTVDSLRYLITTLLWAINELFWFGWRSPYVYVCSILLYMFCVHIPCCTIRSAHFPPHVSRMIYRKALELKCKDEKQVIKLLFFTMPEPQMRKLRLQLNYFWVRLRRMCFRSYKGDTIEKVLTIVTSDLTVSVTQAHILKVLRERFKSEELDLFVKGLHNALDGENGRRMMLLLTDFVENLDESMKAISSSQLLMILDYFDMPIQEIIDAVIKEMDDHDEHSTVLNPSNAVTIERAVAEPPSVLNHSHDAVDGRNVIQLMYDLPDNLPLPSPCCRPRKRRPCRPM